MSTRRALVAANWKMNGTLASIRALLDGVIRGVSGVHSAQVAICPPYVYLPEVGRILAETGIVLGAQNVADREPGAYTGEIAAAMLRDIGCRLVIIGHSERRHIYNESDAVVAEKFILTQAAGLTPILCVGEQLAEREDGNTDDVVARQLDAVIGRAGIGAFGDAIIAYEPVWAIGTGRTATPEQAQEVHAFIRLRLARHDNGIADKIRILYGGSVKADNARELFSRADIDGGLIGGASLKADEFTAICKAAG